MMILIWQITYPTSTLKLQTKSVLFVIVIIELKNYSQNRH